MTAPLAPGSSIGIVGAGIIGSSAAFALSERGFRVTLFDRDEPARTGPSFGNAGQIAGQGIFPLASPGIAAKAIRMLLDPRGPLRIPLAYAVEIIPWLWAFWRTSTGSAQERAIAGLTQLAAGTLDETSGLWTRAGIAHHLTRKNALSLYDSMTSFEADLPDWQRAERAGFGFTAISAEEVRRIEPNIAPIFARGVLSHDYGHVTDPFEVATAMFKAAVARGVGYERALVEGVRGDGDGAAALIEGNAREFDAVLVCAGAWTKALAVSLGERLPVEAERGYNLTFPAMAGLLERPLLLADRGVAATPLTVGLRFGGWTELGGTKLPPNPAYWARIRRMAGEVFPAIGDATGREWMGHRPAMPDSVPVISRSAKSPRVFYAVGHGHYGLSCSAKTARFVTELIGDGADAQLAAFSISRFG